MSNPGSADRYWAATKELLDDAGANCAGPLLRRGWRALRPQRSKGRANYLEIVAIAASVDKVRGLLRATDNSPARERLEVIESAIDSAVQSLLWSQEMRLPWPELDALRKDLGLAPSPRPRVKR